MDTGGAQEKTQVCGLAMQCDIASSGAEVLGLCMQCTLRTTAMEHASVMIAEREWVEDAHSGNAGWRRTSYAP